MDVASNPVVAGRAQAPAQRRGATLAVTPLKLLRAPLASLFMKY